MPRIQRKLKRKRKAYTAVHIHQLLTGVAYLRGEGFNKQKGDGCQQNDQRAMQVAWEKLRDSLLPSFIEKHPGRRPYAWWKFDAPERRRRINGKLHPFDNPKRKAWIKRTINSTGYPSADFYVLSFGKPAVFCVPADWNAVYETEADYLSRLGLLMPGEKI